MMPRFRARERLPGHRNVVEPFRLCRCSSIQPTAQESGAASRRERNATTQFASSASPVIELTSWNATLPVATYASTAQSVATIFGFTASSLRS